MDISALWTAEGALSLVTLSAMETVLGIDNVVFLSILVGKLPAPQQPSARRLGLVLALGTRLLLLFGLSWVMGLTAPLFELLGRGISGRDIILFGGGAFLIAKATREIHEKFESHAQEQRDTLIHTRRAGPAFGLVLVQIAVLDVVFSLDSVITAVGMAQDLSIMITAMVVAMVIMLWFAGLIGDFVERHPTMKMLALSFLILIGVMLVAEGMGQHIAKGYIYFAMAFSFLVELLNLRFHQHQQPSQPAELQDESPAQRDPIGSSAQSSGSPQAPG
ncbi:MAG: Integral rane protein TerC [Myxococcaceae bacterium]|nr:Integral rane protein TerC [Myxococcaceae bacterium]